MNKKLIIMIIIFGGLFLLFSSGIVYKRVDDKKVLNEEIEENQVNTNLEKLLAINYLRRKIKTINC